MTGEDVGRELCDGNKLNVPAAAVFTAGEQDRTDTL